MRELAEEFFNEQSPAHIATQKEFLDAEAHLMELSPDELLKIQDASIDAYCSILSMKAILIGYKDSKK
jgi:hypothetical protein